MMESTIKKFNKGVHSADVCGLNTNGFSSINSVSDISSFHILNNGSMSLSNQIVQIPKFRFVSSDALMYLAVRILSSDRLYENYTFILKDNTPVYPQFMKLIHCYSKMDRYITFVVADGNSYIVKTYFKGNESIIKYTSIKQFTLHMKRINYNESSIYIIFPEFTDTCTQLFENFKSYTWCIPVSRSILYISSNLIHTYYAYPWSRSPSYHGYVIGINKIKLAQDKDKQRYIGCFNYYETVISCIPYRKSCTDCAEMKKIANTIESLSGTRTLRPVSEVMSEKSITALNDMNKRISQDFTNELSKLLI